MPTHKSRTRHAISKKGQKSSRIPTTDPVVLLMVMARALNQCEKAGINPKMKHGIIYTDAGYVLDIKDKWVARPLKGGTW